jgi:hypothetical protein
VGRRAAGAHRPGQRALVGEALGAAGGRLEAGQRLAVEAAALGVPDVVGGAAEAAVGPAVDDVDADRVVDAQVGLQAVGRRPGAEAEAADQLAGRVGGAQWDLEVGHDDGVALRDQALDAELEALHRAVDVARGAGDAGLLAEDGPGLERVADLDRDVAGVEAADQRAAQVHEGLVGGGGQRRALGGQPGQDVLEVAPEVVGQQEPVVQRLAPADQRRAVGGAREGGDEGAGQRRLGGRHARVRRHLVGAELDEALAAVGATGVEELVDGDLGAVGVAGDVDEQVAKEHVAEPGRRWLVGVAEVVGVGERELELGE